MKTKKILTAAIMISLAAGMTACDFVKHHQDTALPGNAIIATSDYSTGALATLDIEAKSSTAGIQKGSVDSDLLVRSYNGLVYVLNRTNNNIQLLDKNFATTAQESTGSYSNPHDLVITGTKGYIALNGGSSIWVIDAVTLKKTGEIDLSSYTPAGSSTPGIDQLWFDSATGYLYVSAERFNADYSTIDYSDVIVIDTATDTVKKEIKLQWTASGTTINAANPYSKFIYASKESWDNGDGHDHLFILCAGLYNTDYSDKKDGGIIAVDISDLAMETGYLVTESYLDSSISDFDYRTGTFYVAANGTETSNLYAVKPGDGSKTSLKSIPGTFKIPFVKMNPTGLLLIGDRSSSAPGVWILDTETNTLTTESVISTGLPPCDIALTE